MAQITNPIISLETYYHYVRAWVLALEREYGKPGSAEVSALQEQQNLKTLNRLQGGGQYSRQLASEFCRAELTVISMEKLPVAEFPNLAATANLWLPVQAYYAVHAMGNALFVASKQQVPKDHRAFRAAFSDSIVRLLPYPFGALCNLGPSVKDFTFTGIKTSSVDVLSQSQLANPDGLHDDSMLGKSLSTTRDRILKEMFQDARRQKVSADRPNPHLNKGDRDRISKRLHETSIADLLYRMRRRANYDNSDMYLAGFNDAKSAVEHYESLTYLSRVIIDLLEAIILRKIGKENMAKMKAMLPQESSIS